MAPTEIDEAAVADLQALIESLIKNPEKLVREKDAVRETALKFAALFHDEASKVSGKGMPEMMVDGFTDEQVWQQLEVQNAPLKKQLAKSTRRLEHLQQEGNYKFLSKELPEENEEEDDEEEMEDDEEDIEEEETKPKKKKDPSLPKQSGRKTAVDDSFFSLDAMESFVLDAEKQHEKMRDGLEEGSENEDSDDEDFDDENDDKAAGMMFSDFFDTNGNAPKGDDEDEKASEAGDSAKSGDEIEMVNEESADEEDEMSNEDAALDASLAKMEKKMAADGDAEDDDEESEMEGLEGLQGGLDGGKGEEDDDESEKEDVADERLKKRMAAMDAGDDKEDEDDEEADDQEDVDMGMDDAEDDAEVSEDENPIGAPKSESELQKSIAKMEAEIEQLENEQLEKKHWSQLGEAQATERPLNSLIELHVDMPMSHFAMKRAAAEAGALGLDEEGDGDDGHVSKLDLERVIKQRIADKIFDDVVPRAEERPADKAATEDPLEGLDTTKSRVGLGEIYAEQYEKEILGNLGNEKETEEKKNLKVLFAKLMYQLDSLCNNHFTPKPIAMTKAGHTGEAGAIQMEDAIPLTMVGSSRISAPEDIKRPERIEKSKSEMSPDEKKALRRSNKARRSQNMRQRLEAGEISLKGLGERNAKLQEKNTKEKKRKADAQSGVDGKVVKKKIRSTQLLAEAGMHVAQDIARKKEAKESRQYKL